ncbi:MAG TPA: hypothetical protein VN976_15915 [Verrucomicrobiae bacterium]|nr:hypothetical protein [Verrucomicrobiae bacterium]
MNMQCEQFEQLLEQQDEGALPKPALAHLETCEACRALSADFSAIHDMALELGNEEVAPPERVWISLRNQLEAERLILDPQAAPRNASHASSGWWSVFQRPAVAGAFLGLVLAAASTVGYMSNFAQTSVHSQLAIQQETSAVPAADSIFKEEVLTVGSDSIPGLQRQDTAVTASIRRNLQIVDNFIAICEKSVREQPDNQMAREYLYGAYQQKAELLATAMNRSMPGGLQ